MIRYTYEDWKQLPLYYTTLKQFQQELFNGNLYRWADSGNDMCHDGVYDYRGGIVDGVANPESGYMILVPQGRIYVK